VQAREAANPSPLGDLDENVLIVDGEEVQYGPSVEGDGHRLIGPSKIEADEFPGLQC